MIQLSSVENLDVCIFSLHVRLGIYIMAKEQNSLTVAEALIWKK